MWKVIEELIWEVAKCQRLYETSFEQWWEEAKAYYFMTDDAARELIEEPTPISITLEQNVWHNI